MPKPSFASDFHRVLYDRVYECSVPDFRTLLEKHGHDDDCLKLMKEALGARLSREDRGDYRDPATPGWHPTREKQKLLDQHFLNRGPTPAFQAAARPAEPDLYTLTDRCLPSEFGKFLQMHAGDPDQRRLIEKALQDRIQREDPGSWGEPSSYGWKWASDKMAIFKDYLAGNDKAAPPVATPPNSQDEITTLRAEVAALKKRIQKLEERKLRL